MPPLGSTDAAVSTDVLRRNVARHLEYVRTIQSRGLPPVMCVFARLEGPPPETGYRPQFSPLPYHEGWATETVTTDALFHPSHHVAEPYSYSSHWTGDGGSHVAVFCGGPRRAHPFDSQADPALDNARLLEAIQTARDVCERLSSLARELPAQLATRLGFVRASPPGNWIDVLFHLGWHFPNHGIEAGRFRILSAIDEVCWEWRCHEIDLQLGGVRVSPDVFPGVIVSRLGEGSDVLAASVCALNLISEALDGIERAARPQPNAEYSRLRDAFLLHAESDDSFPVALSVRVLRLADSFQTPPATEWAGIERGGDGWGVPKYFQLSHLNANRVVCEIRGPGSESFQEFANRAGALLPCWPDQQPSALLTDIGAFARRREPDKYPWAVVVGTAWTDGLVTDHRGNVERWLGFVFGLLMEHRPEQLDLLARPDEITFHGFRLVNTMLTLRGINLFAASAWAIERAGLIPTPEPVVNASATPVRVSQPSLPPAMLQLFRDALALLDQAGTGLARFDETNRPFSDVTAEWDRWRTSIAARTLADAEVALRGLLDRNPAAPHRQLPSDLSDLWLRLKCWGPGRSASWDEFRASPHQTERTTLDAALVALRGNIHRLFLYLGVELPTDAVASDIQAHAVVTGNDPVAVPLTIDEAELAVLNAIYDRMPVLVKNTDIEPAAGLSKQTVGDVIVVLIDKGLVIRPNGERKGATLTPAGVALVERVRKSSTVHP